MLQADGPRIVILAEQLDETWEVDDSSAHFSPLSSLGGSGYILEVHVEDTFVVTDVVGQRVRAIAQVVTDVQAHAHTFVAVLHVVPYVGGIGIEGHVRAVEMDGQPDVILLDSLFHVVEQFVVGYTYQKVYTHAACIGKSPVHLCLAFHIYRSHGISLHSIVGQLLVEGSYLLFVAVKGQMEILDAQIMHIQRLERLERGFQIEMYKGVPCHAQVKFLLLDWLLDGAVG